LKKIATNARAATQGFDFNKLFVGRIDHINYMYYAIGSIVVGLILMYIPIIGLIISLALGVVGLGASARRFHDINMTGWAALLILIPFVNILTVVYLCWKLGDVAPNAFGPVPDKNRELFKAVLNT
jgi:uncharacterized membrane protein YhaH (DUF805 family)